MSMGSRRTVSWLACGLFVLGATALGQDELSIVEVSGRVTDTSGSPIESAVVKADGTDVSAVLTGAGGTYKFYVVGQEDSFSLRVSKEGYTTEFSQPIAPKRKVAFDAVLKMPARRLIKVMMEDFVSGVSISGRVTGLKAQEIDTHKVLLYVLTNKWYIHPYAENTEGKGYARIKADGSWSLRTINRGHHPYKLAILVVPMDYVPPAAVPVEEDAEQSLRAKIGANLVALQVYQAPEGL